MDRDQMLDNIAVLFGGRIAEEIFMDKMTTGASNDFERATQIARDMVTRWGMSDALGPMVYGENEGEVFLGRSVTTHKNMSETTMQKVDAEIRRIIDQQYALATQVLIEEPRQGRGDDQGAAGVGNDRRRSDRRHHGRHPAAPAQAEPEQPGAPAAQDQAPTARPPQHPRNLRRKPETRTARAEVPRGTGAKPCLASCSPQSSAPASMLLHCGSFRFDLSRPLVMGIVNVTPDSFSDGGQHSTSRCRTGTCASADRRGRGHDRYRRRVHPARRTPVGIQEELDRVLPVIEGLRGAPCLSRWIPASPR